MFGALLDCSKAFDMVEWVTLFKELIRRQVSFVFLRVLLFIYSRQKCSVTWNGRKSFEFGVSNGVRQGAVSSPILFGLYLDKLIQMLRKSGIGCTIGKHYLGVMVYADDIILLSPSRLGLQAMINICQKFAATHNLQFSTHKDPNKSKTKCIHFSRKQLNLACISLNGNQLPWVESAKHVGNVLERDNSFSKDISCKRAAFIGKVHSILQEFHFVNPIVKMNIISKYATSFYGSSLWSIFGRNCEKVFTAWNNAIRDTFELPRGCHRYFIEYISNHLHSMAMLSSRFLKFHETLKGNPKPCIRYLSSLNSLDRRTVYSRNLYEITQRCRTDVANLTCQLVKKKLVYSKPNEDDNWKVKIVLDLLEQKWNLIEIEVLQGNFDDSDLIINQLCLQ